MPSSALKNRITGDRDSTADIDVRARGIECFFVEWYGAHRDLHSFPTRRSSDLERHRGLLLHVDDEEVPDGLRRQARVPGRRVHVDRKSTRLNSSHGSISYAV